MILDDDQIWWRMGADDAQWYKFVGEQWVPATPPLPESAQAAPPPARYTADVYDSTLPYLPDSGVQVEVSSPGDTVMSAGFTPMPSEAPTNLDGTIVGPAAYRETLDADVTQPGATLRTDVSALGYGSSTGIKSAIDETVPPQIDAVPVGELAYQAEQRQRSATARTGVLILVAVIALFLVAGALILFLANGWYSGIVSAYEPQIAGLAAYAPEFQTVVIQDAAGREIARLSNSGDRREVDLSLINPYLIHAVISTRNPTFYTDPGWDTGKTLSTWFSSLGSSAGQPQRTITQLVAENLVLAAQTRTTTPLDLVVVAGEMSQRYSKDFILGLFLNEFSFGNNSFGAEAAARFYFQQVRRRPQPAGSGPARGHHGKPDRHRPGHQPRHHQARHRERIRAHGGHRVLGHSGPWAHMRQPSRFQHGAGHPTEGQRRAWHATNRVNWSRATRTSLISSASSLRPSSVKSFTGAALRCAPRWRARRKTSPKTCCAPACKN
ncbi:MAG: hypothetical protein HND48_17560 [Chloroflexi bacterium]|nr:hypothetical protein [Chloroflexota bacterium]